MRRNDIAGARCCRPCALPFGLANDLKVCHRHQSSGLRYKRVASLVPVWIILSADHMEKVAFLEAQLLRIVGIWSVGIKRFDHLWTRV